MRTTVRTRNRCTWNGTARDDHENLDELSPLLKSAFVLREVQGYSTGEAAKTLGVTENTLKRGCGARGISLRNASAAG